jgi:ssRNA-specific RNase YbeY (16S rRNA maturation enzyme)
MRPWTNKLVVVFVYIHFPIMMHAFSMLKVATRQVAATHKPALCSFHSSSQLFGYKPGPNSPDGNIYIQNDQTDLAIDIVKLEQTIYKIRSLIGYPSFDVNVLLVDDAEMRRTSVETRDMDATTDILSFPFTPTDVPGKVKVEFDIPDYYCLGDIVIDVPYVMRRCVEDEAAGELTDATSSDEEDGDVENDSDLDEYEQSTLDDDDRGVSGAMASVYDAEERVRMLLVHGILHLVGYDHMTDEAFDQMATEEERILKELGFKLAEPKEETD